MNLRRSIYGFLLFFCIIIGGAHSVLAIGDNGFSQNPCTGQNCFNPPNPQEIDSTINTQRTLRQQVLTIVNYFLSFVGLVAVVAIIYGGFLWVLSGGEEENVTKGRKIVIWAGAGIILILLSFTIVRFFINAGGSTNPPTPGVDAGPGVLPDGTNIGNEVGAFITGGPTSGPAPLSIQLSGTGSRYPGVDQTIPDSAMSWSYIDRTGQTIDLGTGPVITRTLTDPGRYVFTLRVAPRPQGPETKEGIRTFAVEVLDPGAEMRFTVNGKEAKAYQQFSLAEAGRGLNFIPTVVSIQNAPIQSFRWDFGDGTPPIEMSTPEPIVHIFQKNGTYTVTLTTKDGFGNIKNKAVTVAISDIVARIDMNPAERFVGQPIAFDARNSVSSFGNIIETNWTIIDASGKSETIKDAIFSRTFNKSGDIHVNLSVKDTSGKIGAASEVLHVRSHAPTANFTFKPKSTAEPATIVFDSGLSSDIDSDVLTYSWDFQNDGTFEVVNSASAHAEFTFLQKGGYNVKLRVTDTGGETAEKVLRVEIASTLNVDFTASSFVAHPGEDLIFSAKAEKAITFFWDFGDGSTTQGSAGSVTHAFSKKGQYDVKLTVFAPDDGENSVTRTIFIGEKDAPVAAFDVRKNDFFERSEKNVCGTGKNGLRISRADFLTFDASASINRDGQTAGLEYEWSFPDGTISTEKSARRQFSDFSSEDTCFPVSLTVRDTNSGKSDITNPLWLKIENAPPQFDTLVVSIPGNTIAPAIVPLKVQNPRDPDGTIVEYKWWAVRDGSNEKIGLHTTTTPVTSLIIPVFGLENAVNHYSFVVELKDNLGATVNSETLFGKSNFVEVRNGQNRSPVVDFRMEKTTVSEGDTITFFATASDPLGGTIPDSAYMWDFNGDNIFDAIGTGPQVTHRFDAPGEFEVRLKVVYRGLASSTSHKVFVEIQHKLPRAAFTFQVQGHNVIFNAANSEADASIPNNVLSYAWDFDAAVDSDGDGKPDDDVDATSKETKHFYTDFGSRMVKLIVRDRLGVIDEVTRDVAVGESGTVLDGTKNPLLTLSDRIIESIRLRSDHPITTVDLVLERGAIAVGEKTILHVFVKNANNTLFTGTVTFKVVSGSATLSANSITLVQGQGVVEVTGGEKGKVLLQATAQDTVSGNLSEELSFTVD